MSVLKRRVARRKSNPSTTAIQLPKIMYCDPRTYGLCNQLFCIGCALADAIHAKSNISIKGFYPEMTSATFIPIDRLLNLAKTNENLAIKHTAILMRENPSGRHNANTMFPITAWQSEHRDFCIRSLVFSDEIIQMAQSLCLNEPFYCVHFRLDVDVVIYECGGSDIYHQWLHLTDAKNEVEARKIASEQVERHVPWIQARVAKYVQFVQSKCVDATLPIIALTAIGKPVLLGQNNLMEWAFREFQHALTPRRVLRNTSFPSLGREYSAAVELNIACDSRCVGFIASGGSTFSETIKMRIDAAKQLGCV